MLLGHAGQQPPDADAVGAHDTGFCAVFVQEGGAQGLAVARAQLEDVADLHPARECAAGCRSRGRRRPRRPRRYRRRCPPCSRGRSSCSAGGSPPRWPRPPGWAMPVMASSTTTTRHARRSASHSPARRRRPGSLPRAPGAAPWPSRRSPAWSRSRPYRRAPRRRRTCSVSRRPR